MNGFEVEKLSPGRELVIHLADGSEWSGRYAGIERRPTPVSRSVYEVWTDSLGICPEMGDKISVQFVSGGQVEGELLELTRTNILLSTEDGDRRYPLGAMDRIDGPGACSVGSDVIKDYMALAVGATHGSMDMLLEIANGDSVRISTDDIVQTTLPVSQNKKRNAVLGGLAADAALLVFALVVANSEPEPEPNPNPQYTSSCPFIYSKSSNGFSFEAEPFAAAIAPGLQRTDFVRLPNIEALDDTYSLKVANLLKEIQYVDVIRLLAVDHPPSADIYPSQSATFVEVSELTIPDRAVDLKGRSVLPFVLAADSLLWISNPFGRSPAVESDYRDGIELVFDRPGNVSRMHLILRTQNTNWSSVVFKEIVTELGPHRISLAEAGPDRTPGVLETAMIREGMLNVDVWTGIEWTSTGYIWAVGPLLPRELAHEIDLSGFEGNEVRLRLSAMPGLWTIDWSAATFGAKEASISHTLLPSSATGHLGEDLRGTLSSEDGDYYVMPTNDHQAYVDFEAPPKAENHNRSVILSATGWYEILTDREPTPGLDIVNLVKTPGGVSRFVLQGFGAVEGKLAENYWSSITSP